MNVWLDDAAAERSVRHIVARHFFGTATAVAWLVAALFAVVPAAVPTGAASGTHWLLVLVFGALGGFAASRMRRIGKARVDRGVVLVGVTAVAAIALASALLGWGVASPGVGFLGLLSCLVCAVAGWRSGALVAGLSAGVILGLALAQQGQWPVAGHGVLDDDSLWLRAAMQWALVGAGLAGGMLVSRVVARHLRSAQQREQRFRGLLTIAADAYWEIDGQYRLATLELPRRGAQARPGLAATIGKLPWELPQLALDDDALDLLRAQLEAREPFRDLLVPWCSASGAVRHVLVSGEPRWRARTVFDGYWGVARDVSAEMQARCALQATESRYQELFTHIPTPLVLHANARVLDANPAALAMFGFAELGAMRGCDLLAAYEPGASRERARGDLAALQRLPVGEALPVAEYRLAERGGRRAVVRATSVRLDTPDAAAALSIFVDDTERKQAEDALRRSEALLSHLVASSPDMITLSEMASGRCAMVNRHFERQTGFAAADVVGRSAVELGLWHEPQDRRRFVDAVRSQGHVQDMPTRFVTKGGGLLSMLVSGACFTMDRREYLVINARDVTEAERERLQR
ncbi:MAG TPA: PAS domain S-box protein, partial [Rubrivivax sp.]|nr:PAS domain S-box protein [Rubrivivax sp.]